MVGITTKLAEMLLVAADLALQEGCDEIACQLNAMAQPDELPRWGVPRCARVEDVRPGDLIHVPGGGDVLTVDVAELTHYWSGSKMREIPLTSDELIRLPVDWLLLVESSSWEVLRSRSPGVTLDDVRAMVQEFIRGGPRCIAEVTDEPGAINVRCVVEDINEADLLRGQLEDYLTDHLPAGIVLNVSVLEPKALAPDHGFNSKRSQRAENGGRP